MNKKTAATLSAIAILLSVFSAACGGVNSVSVSAVPDGVYTGKSSEDDKGAYGEVTITVKDGEVADCVYVTWKKDGTIKDEEYGKVNGEISNQEYYDKAQLSVDAMSEYANEFKETSDLSKVDAISGATVSYDQFTEAVAAALKE